jgi:5-formyltetrahydrofolate cyclo-ligase
VNSPAVQAKAALRARLRAQVQRLSPEERQAASASLRRRLQEDQAWRQARSILLYAPLPGEPDVWLLLTEALQRGCEVVLPRFASEADGYSACRVRDPERELRRGQFGIPEPGPQCPDFDLKRLDLALVPGIGFHPDGSRLGRGKGYYDRLLSRVPGWKCGVAFDCQVTVEVPTEPHDIRVDCIVTPTRWHRIASQGRP